MVPTSNTYFCIDFFQMLKIIELNIFYFLFFILLVYILVAAKVSQHISNKYILKN
jgi:hypothetical protein